MFPRVSSPVGLLSCTLFLMAWAGAGRAEAQYIQWRNNYGSAVREASRTQKPVLISFTMEGCSWCRRLDSTTLSNPGIVRRVSNQFVPVKVDGQRQPQLANTYRVAGYPTVVAVSPGGQVLARQNGYVGVAGFSQFLNRAR